MQTITRGPKIVAMEQYQGDSWDEVFVRIPRVEGADPSVVGYTFTLIVKAFEGDLAGDPVVTWLPDMTNASTGAVRFTVAKATTASIAPGDYWWEFAWTDPDSHDRTLIAGRFTVKGQSS